MKKIFLTFGLFLFPKISFAHCPLCTVGAGALAVFAASIGISSVVVGIMIGGFAVALSTWLARLPKTNYFRYQYEILALLIYVGTIWPIMPFVKDYAPLYLKVIGQYGSLLHNTYTVNLFVVGALVGSAIMLYAPAISRFVTRHRGGKILPYQGISIALGLLALASLLVEVIELLV